MAPKPYYKLNAWQGALVLIAIYSLPTVLWFTGLIVFSTLCLMLFIIVTLFGIIPIIFRCSYALQRGMVFLNFVQLPLNADFGHPLKYGLNDTRNFYVNTEQDVKIGVWHVLPASLSDLGLAIDEDNYNEALGNGEPIIIYFHGNSGTRASGHRVDMYKLLRNLNYHVIAFDYRSYADSSPVPPTEAGVVSDSIYVYKWVARRAKKAKIFFWGHSLGTGISSHALDILARENIQVNGLFLEAPFNNLRDEICEHPLARFFRFLPWFEYFMVDPMGENMLLFETDRHLANFHCPVLILHAKDDLIVPYILGKRLYTIGLLLRRDSGDSIKLISFEKEEKLGHKFIVRHPQLPSIVKDFVSSHMQ